MSTIAQNTLLLLLLTLPVQVAGSAPASPSQRSVIVSFTPTVDLTQSAHLPRPARGRHIVRTLQANAASSQNATVRFLAAHGVTTVAEIWLTNELAITAPEEIIAQLLTLPGVSAVRDDSPLRLSHALLDSPGGDEDDQPEPEWNIEAIGAHQLWELGITGDGVVIASLDSGIDHHHLDLANRWRGGSNSWYDPHGEHATPYDADGHGTHALSIALGGSFGDSAIGVAPGAEWIAAKIFNDAGDSTLSAIHLAYQWILDPDGNPETDDAPRIVNNSWGFNDSPGLCLPEFQADIKVLKAAGIAVVFAAGGTGPGEGTSISPPNYPESFSVGAVDSELTIFKLSSRGPAACDGTEFPHLSAPGVEIRAADLTAGGLIPHSFAYVTGTSFAAPHVSGAMALLMEAFPAAPLELVETALRESAVDGGPPGPDSQYGHGILNVQAAFAYLDEIIDCNQNQDCFSSIPCAHDSCVEGKCQQVLQNELCDDEVECTRDLCTTEGCINELVDLLCIDEDDCTSDSCTAVGCQHIALEDCPPDTTDPEPLPESEWDPELQSTPDLLSEQDVEVVTGEDLEYSPDVGDLHTSSELNSDADVMPHEDSPPPASGCSATPPHDPTTILLLFVALLQIVSLLRVRRPT